jgi:hypothetical protein
MGKLVVLPAVQHPVISLEKERSTGIGALVAQ